MDVHYTAPQDGGSTVAVIYQFFNAGVYVDYSFVLITPTHGQTQNDLYDLAHASMVSYATAHSYTVSAETGWYPDAATVSRAGIMSVADKVALAALVAATGPSSYQTIVSQSGTAAPAVAGGMTPINTYAGTPTFTWTRTAAGTYRLTASSAVFNTNGKTGVFMSNPNAFLNNFKATIISSTVIEIQTATLSVLSLILTPGNADALLNNTMVYIQTYA